MTNVNKIKKNEILCRINFHIITKESMTCM